MSKAPPVRRASASDAASTANRSSLTGTGTPAGARDSAATSLSSR